MEARGIHRRTPVVVDDLLVSKFESGQSEKTASGCIEWTKGKRDGYGSVCHRGKVLSTHVVSYVINNGPVPAGLIIGHKCDNRICCNPDHLEAITPRQNAIDAGARGRFWSPKGANHPSAVFTDDQAALIKALYSRRRFSYVRISQLLNLKVTSVRDVIRGYSYAHIEPSIAS